MAINLNPAQEGSISTITAGVLGQAQLTTALADIYTVPTSSTAKIDNAVVTNITAGAITVTIHVVPPSGTAGPTNAVEFARSIAANTSLKLDSLVNTSLAAGAKVRALASANTSLNITISGHASS